MSTRKRIRSSSQTITGSGGGSGSVGGIVAWGPNFGKDADDTFEAQGAVTVSDYALVGELAPAAAALLAALEVTRLGTLSSAQAADLAALALDGDATAQAAALLSALEATYGLAGAEAVALAELALTGQTTSQQALDLTEMALEGALTPQGAVLLTALEMDLGDKFAAQAGVDLWSVDVDGFALGQAGTADLEAAALTGTVSPTGAAALPEVELFFPSPRVDTFVPKDTLCSDDTVHGTDDSVRVSAASGVADNWGFVQYDLGGIPADWFVVVDDLALTLTYHVLSYSGVGGHSVDIWYLTNADDEQFINETTLSCNDIDESGISNVGDNIIFASNTLGERGVSPGSEMTASAWFELRTAIESRFGGAGHLGYFTFVFRNTSAFAETDDTRIASREHATELPMRLTLRVKPPSV